MYFYSARKMSKAGAAVVKTEDSGVVIGRVGHETAATAVSMREKWLICRTKQKLVNLAALYVHIHIS